MTGALNFTTRALEQLSGIDNPAAPLSTLGFRYICDKLRQAQVFVLPDHGTLLDRDKPRPELDGIVLRPPFPVVALEYTAKAIARTDPFYTAATCSRRIALAWEWKSDLPTAFRAPADYLSPGVVIASIAFYDSQQLWMPIFGAVHFAYDDDWMEHPTEASVFRERLIKTGGISAASAKARSLPCTPVPILPEAMIGTIRQLGEAGMADILRADVMDEANAYFDMCWSLACRNVRAERHAAPDKLNRQRLKAGKLPFADHHTLVLDGADGNTVWGGGPADRAGPRSHLRRGHIRRLAPDRVTWVNQTMVRGRGGFVSKDYRMKEPA